MLLHGLAQLYNEMLSSLLVPGYIAASLSVVGVWTLPLSGRDKWY